MNVPLLKWQMDWMQRANEPFLIASCGVSSGKTHAGAIWVVQRLLKGERVLVGAQTYPALQRVIFQEIQSILSAWGIPYKFRKTEKEIVVGSGIAIGYTYENPTSILGLSNINSLLMDEASYSTEECYNYAVDRMRGPLVDTPRIRLITSPDNYNAKHAWFISLAKRKQLEGRLINASALDNKFTSNAFKQTLLERYKPDTPIYNQQVLGLLIDADVANCIISKAEFPTECRIGGNTNTYMGVDLASTGGDDTAFVICDDNRILDVVRTNEADTFSKISIAKELIVKYNVHKTCLDVTGGFGDAMYDSLTLSGHDVVGINFGAAGAKDSEANIRTSMYFNAVSDIREGFFIEDECIREEMSSTQYTITNRGLVSLIAKTKIKEILGRSPDSADAFVLSRWAAKLASSCTDSANAAMVANRVLNTLHN